jgi:uncharacterized protein (TIGR02284 family)
MCAREEEAMSKKAVDVMNDQIYLDRDAIEAYDEAIGACESESIRTALTGFRADHQRHVTELSEKVRALGGEPPQKPDVKGFFIHAFTAVASRGDRSALYAMRANEELTNRSYQSAVDADLPSDVHELLFQNLEDERRHLAWIKDAIAKRAWEAGEPRARPPAQPPAG